MFLAVGGGGGVGVVVGLASEVMGLVTLVALLHTNLPASRTEEGSWVRQETSGTIVTSGTSTI